ncbi:Dihydrodipicolinate synthase/N-acetylneuraminate lyase [Micromonospora rhizosphaerae]|uniref:Dihydrodipicolinate synthase/N-acetylneuraminate lyase n=1 Tax=Micromonospora rhizosphaerae TaxID=568872 RepID=A0A1C6SBC2_9ACTN|nr:dihydrodipicolinate synthase family protein [Micromonospora rhizosphaerae]SCL26756.1 Dihydrodipicolinate synthase/N-acetylneuraminate lyase [Micromonospora rhizosphaerae]
MLTAPSTRHAAALDRFRRGCVIPAHPLALDERRRLDERRQRALTRYYLASGAGGIAVGVHTTQFAIHDPQVGLLAPVLELAAETAAGSAAILVAGACGPTAQAVAEAELAASLGYHMVLLSPHAGLDEDALIDRARAVGEVLPVVGFYLQPAVGGRELSRTFWTRLAALDAVVGIKVAPFDRYRTLDVLHGVCAAGRNGDLALYTGNDDHILADLVAPHRVMVDGRPVKVEFVGGLLGQWAVWARSAVGLLDEARRARAGDDAALRQLLTLDGHLTDANAAIFDAANHYHGCIPGIHEVLRRQGLLAGRWCLDPTEELSPGQLAELDRVHEAYPHLRDDDFVAEHLDEWLA